MPSLESLALEVVKIFALIQITYRLQTEVPQLNLLMFLSASRLLPVALICTKWVTTFIDHFQ